MRRHLAMFLLAQSIMLAVLFALVLRLSYARELAEESLWNAAHCHYLSSQIEGLREQKAIAAPTGEETRLSSGAIYLAAEKNGVEASQVQAIQRLAPEAIEKSDYLYEDTAIRIRGVMLPQLFRLALELESIDNTSRVSRVTLNRAGGRQNATPKASDVEMWDVQLILTRLDYVARSTRPTGPVRP